MLLAAAFQQFAESPFQAAALFLVATPFLLPATGHLYFQWVLLHQLLVVHLLHELRRYLVVSFAGVSYFGTHLRSEGVVTIKLNIDI